MKHRVLHLIGSLARHGQGSQLQTLAGGLISNGHSVRVIALRDGPMRGSLESAGATVDVFPKRHRIDPLVTNRVRRLARAWRPSVVHAWDPVAAGVAHAAGVGPLVVGVRCRKTPRGGVKGWLAARTDRSVASYLAASRSVVDGLLAAGRSPERVRLLERGVDPIGNHERLSREQAFAELGLPAQARAIAIVSRITPAKNVRELIWCADLVRVLEDDTRVVIFGEGPVRGELERFARMASDLEHVRFAGLRGDVRALLPHFEMLWHAGDESAPPVAVLEAMAAGLPVVADSSPGAAGAIVHEQTGFLVPASGRAERARVTRQLLADTDLRKRLGGAALRRAETRYAAEPMVRGVVEAYEQAQPESSLAAVAG